VNAFSYAKCRLKTELENLWGQKNEECIYMYVIASSSNEFKQWTLKTEKLLKAEPWINFLTAYASLERFLFRVALALKIFQGEYSQTARKQLKKSGLQSLVGFCSNSMRGGNLKLRVALSNAGLSNDKIKDIQRVRNQLVHGADLGNRNAASDFSSQIWNGLRNIADIKFGDIGSHPRVPYQAWQRLLVKRQKRKTL
jgi:hypothetical protein